MFYIALSSVWRREVRGRRVRAVALQHVTGMRLNLDGSATFHVKLIRADGRSLESRSVRFFSRRFVARFRPGRALPGRWTEAA